MIIQTVSGASPVGLTIQTRSGSSPVGLVLDYSLIPSMITTNLLVYLDAGNPTSYPGSGTTWTNLGTTGATNNCTLSNITYDSANGGSIVFNGSTSTGSIPAISGTGNTNNPLSFAFWVYPQDTDGNMGFLQAGGWNAPQLFCANSKFGGWLFNASEIIDPSSYTQNNWYYVAFVYSVGDYCRLFVNGVQVNNTSASGVSLAGSNATFTLCTGNPGLGTRGALTCKLGAVQVYSGKALTNAEVLQNFQAMRGRYGV